MSKENQDVSEPKNGGLEHHLDEPKDNLNNLRQDRKSASVSVEKSDPEIDSKDDLKTVTYETEILGDGEEVLILADGSRILIEENTGKQKHHNTEDNTGATEERELTGDDIADFGEVVDDLKRGEDRSSGNVGTEESSVVASQSYNCPLNCLRCCTVL